MGAAVVIEGDIEAGEVPLVLLANSLDPFFFRDSMLLGADHDGGAMRIVSAYEDASMTAEFLEPHPNVGLDVLHQMANMDGPIGVGQGGSDENPSLSHERVR